ncbi:MAG: adenylate kinase family protein [Desulfurococcaceae archaeon]
MKARMRESAMEKRAKSYGKVIVVTGTPGVGKTRISQMLAKVLNALHIDLSLFVIEKGLYTEYDEEAESYVIDEERVVEELRKVIEERELVIVDSHYGEIVPEDYVALAIVLRIDPVELRNRLIKKGWKKAKVRENVEAELLSICTINAIEAYGENRVFEVDTTGKEVGEVIDEILRIIRGEGIPGHRIDWLNIKNLSELEEVIGG